ncbi:MAG: hypothetical protein ACE5D3_01595 [Candidatus Binatia bacterium]
MKAKRKKKAPEKLAGSFSATRLYQGRYMGGPTILGGTWKAQGVSEGTISAAGALRRIYHVTVTPLEEGRAGVLSINGTTVHLDGPEGSGTFEIVGGA